MVKKSSTTIRHPEIVLKHTEVLSKARAAVTEEKIREWFLEAKDYLTEEEALDILKDPSRMYNLDETGVQTCPKTGQEKQSITVLCCYAASGTVVDPMVVYPNQRIAQDVMQGVPENFAVGRSPSSWMISATFYEYIADVFYQRLVRKQEEFPVLLVFDGHKSHINLELHEFCVEKRILLICLPPNATHILQPCNVGIFRPLNVEWRKVVRNHQARSIQSITKVNFAPLFHEAFNKASKVETIQNAFATCGLFPFNPD
ncbi:uncharacterized protein LOC117175391 [Belonocnema kinseyi]|uniref:uncharacterized protein LOC117175391 n=1 Tax=Belonocnema kinseyi TaxID=2817044 RepID=UPI00143D6E54|nr:uncharacterized protein LOC117175391 [Belonocnema kinseyi]